MSTTDWRHPKYRTVSSVELFLVFPSAWLAGARSCLLSSQLFAGIIFYSFCFPKTSQPANQPPTTIKGIIYVEVWKIRTGNHSSFGAALLKVSPEAPAKLNQVFRLSFPVSQHQQQWLPAHPYRKWVQPVDYFSGGAFPYDCVWGGGNRDVQMGKWGFKWNDARAVRT